MNQVSLGSFAGFFTDKAKFYTKRVSIEKFDDIPDLIQSLIACFNENELNHTENLFIMINDTLFFL